MEGIARMFREMQGDEFELAGGKGGTLARLLQAGYPVPDGFVVLPAAFDGDVFKKDAWEKITGHLNRIRMKDRQAAFAVRSSALAEDSAYASFAGEFETVLDVHTDEAVRAAILQVQNSRKSERVAAYSKAKGLKQNGHIAVVIQKLVRADISGILFTADPVTGNRFNISGNYVYGFGAELVSGEVEPYTFVIKRPKGEYEGPDRFRRYSKKLYKIAEKLQDEFGFPQDIEWAVEHGKIYLLQSRPITTLQTYDPQRGEWNHSRSGDYLWVGNEVFPDIMTPATWSVFRNFQNMNINNIDIMGNIYGRLYMNFSLAFKMFELLKKSDEYKMEYVALTTGFRLEDITKPEIPMTIWQLLKEMLPKMVTMLPKQFRLMGRFDQIIEENPEKCNEVSELINRTTDKDSLDRMWDEQLFPFFWDLLQVQDKANEDYFFPYIAAKFELAELIGIDKTAELLSKLTGGSTELASIKPLIELQRLAQGEIIPEEYVHIAGHRPEKENEVSTPRLYEQDGWVEKRTKEYKQNPIDYISMAEARAREFDAAWADFSSRYPRQAGKIWKKLDKTLNAMEKREIIRSELTRSLGVIRKWFLRCGELLNLGDDIFFLQSDEVQEVLRGSDKSLDQIQVRKKAYERQVAMPSYPFIISGRFNAYEWIKDPDRRSDVFDSHKEVVVEQEEGLIRGNAGSSGKVEGKVRVLHSASEGDEFKQGEILVASTTNVGWTPLFPRASAVVTDVGAPLSHAAIIARELGIPAVVGTGDATMRLKTGDVVVVDGGQGLVWIKK